MKNLDFSTVIVSSTVLMVMVLFVLARLFSSSGNKGGLAFCMVGMAFFLLGGSTEFLRHGSKQASIFWSYVSVVAVISGFAFILAGIRSVLAIGLPRRWYLSVAFFHMVIVLVLYLAFRKYLGSRTIAFSAASILLVLPNIILNLRGSTRIRHVWLCDSLFSILVIVSAARLAFAVMDVQKDKFLPATVDSWLFLIIIASAVGSIATYVFMIAQTYRDQFVQNAIHVGQGKTRISLGEKGLSQTEIRTILLILEGKSIKEAATDSCVATSTIRNTLAHAYRKLGVSSMVGLISLTKNHEITH